MSSSKSSKNAVSLMRYFIPLKKYPLLLLLALQVAIANGQGYLAIDTVQYNCYYNYTFVVDSTSNQSLKSEEMLLQIGKHCSRFSAAVRITGDSITQSYSSQELTAEVGQKLIAALQAQGGAPHRYCSSSIYKNFPEKNKTAQIERLNKQQLMAISSQTSNWHIVANSDTTIHHYACQKATTYFAGRNYVAWFSPELPISDGPYKFTGLPGLIVKLVDTKHQHLFELDEFSKPKTLQPIFYPSKQSIEVSTSAFNQAWKTNIERLYSLSQSFQLQMTDEKRAQSGNKFKSMNNYIEQYK